MMTTQRKLAERLEANGWRIKTSEQGDLEWWADEIWALSSRWSQEGVEAYITLLVDPMWSGLRMKGQGVWAAGANSHYPLTKDQAVGLALLRLRSSQSEINDFVATINATRTAPRPNDAA